MKAKKILIAGSVMIAALFLLSLGLSQAQEPLGRAAADRPAGVNAVAASSDRIPIQGRLTDDSGNPLDGDYSLTFSLYGVSTGGTALCADTQTVSVVGGLFSASMELADCDAIDGRQLYLGVQVESDPEMTPRQAIDNVPYAWSLRPGALISDTQTGAVLDVRNGGSGTGVRANSDTGYGLAAQNWSDNHAAVYGFNYAGNGVVGVSGGAAGVKGGGVIGVEGNGTDVDFSATGSGVIQSVAKSYVWISGNDLQKKLSSDTTQFECDFYGGVMVTRGGSGTARDVMLPVTLPGQLYGQDVTVTGMDVYFESQTDFDGIGLVTVRRQSGAGSGDLIIQDDTDRVCETACSFHLDFTENNVLDNQHGIVYIAFQLFFSGSDSYVRIGGVRLTLEHD